MAYLNIDRIENILFMPFVLLFGDIVNLLSSCPSTNPKRLSHTL